MELPYSSSSVVHDPTDTVLVPVAPPLAVTRAAARWTVWDSAVRVILFAALILVLLSFADYGITHDEEVQAIYGEKLLSWYSSWFVDESAFEYLDLFWYGGLFDLVSAFLNKISPFGYYETRHLLGGLVGVAGIAGAWRLGRLAGGPRAGFIAAVLMTLTPCFIGHSFNNPKDGPFAVAMLWAIYALARLTMELPRPSWRSVAWFGAAAGAALSTRVGALLLVGYFGLAVLVYFGARWRLAGWGQTRDQVVALSVRMALGLAICIGLVAVFWPWAVQNPINPILALSHFSGYDIEIDSLFNGVLVPATNLPRLYIIGYLAVTMPEALLFGLAAFAIGVAARKRQVAEDGRVVALVALAALFPIAFFMVFRPTAYDGLRHFLFVVPPLAILAALGLERVWTWAERRSKRSGRAVALALFSAAVIQCVLIARLHPDEYIYYNAFVGGVRGAENKWELDYWSNSLHEAVDRLADVVLLENGGKVPASPARVIVCGNGLSATYYFPSFLQTVSSMEEADFIIAYTQADCWQSWRGRPVAEIERFGAVLSVIKDRRGLPNRAED